jgi:hypothetical protein
MATADAAHGLRIKYGLRRDPEAAQVEAWARRTRELIKRGSKPDEAGASAAKELFPDYRTHVYASEADTLLTLLEAAEKK